MEKYLNYIIIVVCNKYTTSKFYILYTNIYNLFTNIYIQNHTNIRFKNQHFAKKLKKLQHMNNDKKTKWM